MPRQPIAVATDLKPRGDRAIDRAILLGKEQDRPVKVIHVIDDELLAEQGRGRCEELVRAVLPDSDAHVEILLPSGSPPRTIAHTAEEHEAAILVAGVASFNDLRDYFLGTAVDYIVRHAAMPVLVVKQRPHKPYRSILAATDFSDASADAIAAAARLFPDATIDILHAYHVPYESWQKADYVRDHADEQSEAELARFMDDPRLKVLDGRQLTTGVAYGGVERAIADRIEETSPDLLVLGTHGQGGFRHAALGSMAETLLHSAEIDTLMVRSKG